MNLVGAHGKGESVWLAFFLYDILKQFADVAASHNDDDFAQKCLKEAAALQERIEADAWDGEWYLRAFFDDGTPLGTAAASECQIDALPQSWAVLSGAGRPDRAEQAMHMAYNRLVDQEERIIKLFDPPFDKSLPSPGYIKGYVPGVRENGGQYTHAAVWSTMAFAALGDAKKAWQMFHMINPINHALNEDGLATYRVEPYVMAADVYAVAPHTGRGGWTWYTGSAGWTYRLIVESLLGLTLKANELTFKPCVPAEWTEYKVRYRYRQTYYHITIHLQVSAGQSTRIVVDGTQIEGDRLRLVDDRQEHRADIYVAPTEDTSLTDLTTHGTPLPMLQQMIDTIEPSPG
jgi:cellobiose phosphorylase